MGGLGGQWAGARPELGLRLGVPDDPRRRRRTGPRRVEDALVPAVEADR